MKPNLQWWYSHSEIHSLNFSAYQILTLEFLVRKSKLIGRLVMNQIKGMNGIPKLRYVSMMKNMGLPKGRESYGDGVTNSTQMHSCNGDDTDGL